MDKKKSQVWIYVVVALVVIGAGAFWWFTNKKSSEVAGDVGAPTPAPEPVYAKPGEATKVSELSPACKKVYDNWLTWMKTTKGEWYLNIEKSAKESGKSLAKALEDNWIHTYNQGTAGCE